VRRLVLTPHHVRASGRAWIVAFSTHPELVRSILRRTSYWVFDPEFDDFYPSKWAGFEGMAPARYLAAIQGEDEGGASFQGTTARRAIEGAVGEEFDSSDHLTAALTVWATARVTGVLEGVDTSKWEFVALPTATDPNAGDGDGGGSGGEPPGGRREGDDDFWRTYDESWAYYETTWGTYNQVLYDMCQRLSGHGSLADVVAKVGIVARAYAAGLERHGDPEGPGAIVGVATVLHKRADEVDDLIARLRRVAASGNQMDDEIARQVVALHGEFEAIVREVTNDGHSVRSWSSKYLHFHAPGVPIYDSRARGVVKGRYDLRRVRNQHITCPPTGDYAYAQFVNGFLSLWSEAVERGLPVSVRRLDQFLLWTADRQ
jgi:hypothetical protein